MYLPPTTFRATFLQVQAMVLILIQPDRSLFSHLKLILLLPVCATAMRHRWLSLPLPTPQGLHLPAYGPGHSFSPPGLPTSVHRTGLHFSPLGYPSTARHFPAWPVRVLIPMELGLPLCPAHALLLAVGWDGTGCQILPGCSWPWPARPTQCPENVLVGVTGNTGGFHLQIHKNYISRCRKQMPTLRHFVASLSQLYSMKRGICNSIL